MNTNNKTGLSFFFLYIFPLVFSYVGTWKWGAWASTGSLLVGIVAWTIFIREQYKEYFKSPENIWKKAVLLQRNGKHVDAEVTKVVSRKRTESGNYLTEIEISFPNLVGTMITTSMEFEDTKPEQKRYEVGKKFALKLNTQKPVDGLPWINAEGEIHQNKPISRWLFAFSFVYAIATFIGHYTLFSDGQGWRFITLLHPWVATPFIGLGMMGATSRIEKKLKGRNSSSGNYNLEFELLLYGVETQGKITKSSQTGTYINEQPEMVYTVSFTDRKGETHFIDQKEVVLLNEMKNYQPGDVRVLYLPSDPKVMLLVWGAF